MTKEITKSFILQEITDKLALRESIPARFLFDETVVPVYNIDEHLGRWVTDFHEVSITATGGYGFLGPGRDEQWFVRGYNVIFMAAGAYKVAGAYVTRALENDVFMYLDLTKNQAESYAVNLPQHICLKYGDYLRINVDEYTSTANLRLYIDVKKEVVR